MAAFNTSEHWQLKAFEVLFRQIYVCFGVTYESFQVGIERQSSANPHCDIGHVAQRCRAMSLLDIGI